jgi:hypothetical protein
VDNSGVAEFGIIQMFFLSFPCRYDLSLKEQMPVIDELFPPSLTLPVVLENFSNFPPPGFGPPTHADIVRHVTILERN